MRSADSSGVLATTTIKISNIHCNSCVAHISRTLGSLLPPPISHVTSISSKSVGVIHDISLPPQQIIKSLFLAGFEIDSCISVQENGGTEDILPSQQKYWLEELGGSLEKIFTGTKRKKHIQQCQSCQIEVRNEVNVSDRRKTLTSINSRISPLFRIMSQQQAMSDIESQTPESIFDSLSSNTVDSGLEEVQIASPSVEEHDVWQAMLSIRGMTCSSCVGSIRNGLSYLPYIDKVEISALTHGGIIVFKGKGKLDTIVEQIDNMGYDVEVIEVAPFNEADFESKERTITIKIDGLHCS